MIALDGVPWRPWDSPMFRFDPGETGDTISKRMPLHPGVLHYRHDMFMASRRKRQRLGREEMRAWFEEEMRGRGQL
jgi:hypothetical protein